MGVAGYMAIEGWSFLDALYMTVITLSTVGYKEVGDLSTGGRVFSIFLIVGGVGVIAYAFGAAIQYLGEAHLGQVLGRRRMRERVSRLADHMILCGYGEVGREVARVFEAEGVKCVVIEMDPEAAGRAAADGYLYVSGNATTDDVLNEAGIMKARGLVAAVGSDADNLYITLSVKGIRPDLLVVARARNEESESKLKRAGADRVILPLRLGGQRMAMLALHPLVVDFIETTMHRRGGDLFLEDIRVSPGSPVAGMTIREGQQCCGGGAILAVKKRDGALVTSPSQEATIEPGDELVILGTRQQLRGLEGSV